MEKVQEFMQTLLKMQWSDYLDIIVVAFLIYKLLPLIRTPHIMKIARTVIALILVTWITDAMKLHTINWILDQVLAIGLLAFVVLFQPELRRMLDHLGNVKLSNFFGSSKPMQEMEKVIDQTVMACERMSSEMIGALIVFERKQHLDEYFKTGTVIDAQVSEQLLRNIFFKNSPLHDGAVIIRDGRVAAASCMLPLSESEKIKHLGTRHHASVGVSEVSDAVVVVVSEQTGSISVASGGMLKRHLAPQTLGKLLKNELCPEATEDTDPATKVLKKIAKKKEADGHAKE